MPTNSPRSGVRLRLLLGVSLLLLAAGCSSRGTITGKVLLQGKPLPGGTVQFIHPKQGSMNAPIGQDGSYQFVDVPAGEVTIAVIGAAPPMTRELPKGMDWEKVKQSYPGLSDEEVKRRTGFGPVSPPPGGFVSVPEKYSNPETSGLTYTVTGGAQTHDIVLE
jgi:hypothetical protein